MHHIFVIYHYSLVFSILLDIIQLLGQEVSLEFNALEMLTVKEGILKIYPKHVNRSP